MDTLLFGSMVSKTMNKKKILISANVIFTIANFRIELIKFLLLRNYEIVCVASKDELSGNAEEVLEKLGVRFIEVSVSRKGLNPIEDLKYLLNLIKIYKNEKPNTVMHFTIKPNIYGTLACRFLKIPSINTINGLGSGIIKENFLSKILKVMYKTALKFSYKTFFQNNDDKEFFINNNLVSTQRVGIVPGSGVDTQSFNTCTSNTKELTFILIARLLKDKGIYEYIEAIKSIKKTNKHAIFLLAGQFDFGNPSAITQDEVKAWTDGNIIQFIGKTDDIKNFFTISDVVVLPSYREGLSRVLIEAASASKPIITTNVPGCKDVVDDSVNGFLCEVKNSSSLEISLKSMIELNETKIYDMGLESKKIAQSRFDKDIVNSIYLKEIEKICSI